MVPTGTLRKWEAILLVLQAAQQAPFLALLEKGGKPQPFSERWNSLGWLFATRRVGGAFLSNATRLLLAMNELGK